MEKRVIIAVVLSILVISIWHKFTADMYPAQQSISSQQAPAIAQEEIVEPYKENIPDAVLPIDEKEYVFENEQFVVTFSNIGGCIKSINLKEYKDGNGRGFYNLMSEEALGRGIFVIESQKLGIQKDTFAYGLRETMGAIEYTADLPGNIKVEKRYIFKNQDLINFEIIFKNQGSGMRAFGYDVIGGVNIEAIEPLASRYIQVDAKIDEKVIRGRGPRSGVQVNHGAVQWSALKNKYFVMLLKPFDLASAGIIAKYDKTILASGIRMAEMSLSPGSEVKHDFLLYAGPKITERLAATGMGFEEVINFGVFGGISNILLGGVRLFYKVTHNWGVSIIILSFLVNLIMSPLTRKSFKSMKDMQKLQPEIKALQDKYKKNPQKINKEIMELYKIHKVNPLSGCFPLILQMPVFIALYQGLIRFIELKNASFLWITDLSMPDNVMLPFAGGKEIHILPILMGGVMFFQQKFSHPQHQAGLSEQQMQQQKMMGFMMPILFGFIFYNFPSGLVLYWFTNTLVMTLTQMLMMRKGA